MALSVEGVAETFGVMISDGENLFGTISGQGKVFFQEDDGVTVYHVVEILQRSS